VYVGIHKDDAEQDWKEKVDRFVRRIDKLQVFDQTPPPSAPPLEKRSKSV
jgi:hypothetical protein